MMSSILYLLNDYTFQIVALGSIALGILSGVAGSFAVIRKQSLLGDSIAHASLAGISIAFMITQSKNTSVLLLGALVFGIIAAMFIRFFSKNTRVNYESSLALVMASLFGLGLVLLTQIQKSPNANQAGLERFLFGQAATILKDDVIFTVGLTVVVVCVTVVFFKELKLYCFDPIYSKISGTNTLLLEIILSSFVVASVIAGIQMVGVVLISALLIIPSVAARQWTNRFSTMIVLASIIGALSGLIGTLMSSLIPDLPTGPSIVLISCVFVFISLVFAPKKGVISQRIRRKDAIVSHKAEMILVHHFLHHGHPLADVFDFNDAYFSTLEHHIIGINQSKLRNNLLKRGYIKFVHHGYALTDIAINDLFGGDR